MTTISSVLGNSITEQMIYASEETLAGTKYARIHSLTQITTFPVGVIELAFRIVAFIPLAFSALVASAINTATGPNEVASRVISEFNKNNEALAKTAIDVVLSIPRAVFFLVNPKKVYPYTRYMSQNEYTLAMFLMSQISIEAATIAAATITQVQTNRDFLGYTLPESTTANSDPEFLVLQQSMLARNMAFAELAKNILNPNVGNTDIISSIERAIYHAAYAGLASYNFQIQNDYEEACAADVEQEVLNGGAGAGSTLTPEKAAQIDYLYVKKTLIRHKINATNEDCLRVQAGHRAAEVALRSFIAAAKHVSYSNPQILRLIESTSQKILASLFSSGPSWQAYVKVALEQIFSPEASTYTAASEEGESGGLRAVADDTHDATAHPTSAASAASTAGDRSVPVNTAGEHGDAHRAASAGTGDQPLSSEAGSA